VNPLNPKVGELVQSVLQITDLPVFDGWEKFESVKPIYNLRSDEIGIVIESLEERSGNGCKILFRGDKVGWVNINYLKRLGSETG
jgi:hypothetical protein